MIWTLAGTYFLLVVLLNIPTVQTIVGNKVAEALSSKLNTEVRIGKLDLGLFNRIIINDVLIYDQNSEEMLRASRLSAKINYLDLLNQKITISAAQLFGINANLYKVDENAKPNFQFVLDALASNDTTSQTPLNLQISSVIIRRGKVAYNERSDYNDYKLSPKHINLSDISAHLILNALTNDSINLNVKKLAFKDKTGFTLKRLSLKLAAGQNGAMVEDFVTELPNTSINIPYVRSSFRMENKKIAPESLRFNGLIHNSNITLSDLAGFIPSLNSYHSSIALNANANGDGKNINIPALEITQKDDVALKANATITDWMDSNPSWLVNFENIKTSSSGIQSIISNINPNATAPSIVDKLGNIITSAVITANKNNQTAKGKISADIGDIAFDIKKVGNAVNSILDIDALNLHLLTGNNDLGIISPTIRAQGLLAGNKLQKGEMKLALPDFAYKGYHYEDVEITSELKADKMLYATLNLYDENGNIELTADYDTSSKIPSGAINAIVTGLNPNELGLTEKWPQTTFTFSADANIKGSDINSAVGNVNIYDFSMSAPGKSTFTKSIALSKDKTADNHHKMILMSDFASLRAEGEFDYTTLAASLMGAIKHRLPTLPGLEEVRHADNKINLYGTITNSDFIENVFDIPLHLNESAHIIADIDDGNHAFNLTVDATDFNYNGTNYHDGYVVLSSPNDSLKARININSTDISGKSSHYLVRANAIDNHLTTNIQYENQGRHYMKGVLNADARFTTNDQNLSEANIHILPSDILIADTTWTIDPAVITYYKNHLEVDHFAVHHDNQHITINGMATQSPFDKIEANLKNVNVAYILDLVNFHSVEFAGTATGYASAQSLFSDPRAEAKLHVNDFCFESGRFGTLDVDANWNKEEGAINVDGIISDEEYRSKVTGYISPKNSDIDLKVEANGIYLGFIEKYTNSFLNNLNARAWGNVNIVGPLKCIQLIGEAHASGNVGVTPLNTSYTLHNGRITLQPDNIHFDNDTIYDANGRMGIVYGDLFHQHLGHFTFDINADAYNLLALDIKDFGDDTFCGTVYATGTCNIRDVNGDVVIDVDATPERGSQIVYNAASPDAITNREFIRWHDRDNKDENEYENENENENRSHRHISSDLYLNLLIRCNPNATLKVLMDQTSGDHIALQGNGVIRASYYNKGSFDLFGNYVVNSGIYTLTVQNLLKREFEFQPGGTIAFGGDAYNAALNLQALYTVNGVPLSDINIGKSFTNNNVRVDCLMNISGTPGQPHVEFSLDMPTVSTDAKQMVMSLMKSEEEMNQQVLYLLAIGRFLNQNNNSSYSDASRQSQTSLAMQSILSGTLSQQLSSMLSNVVRNNNWNFGANISTGDEGFNNAEYEGLLSGRLLNNRLLINGQFGYRDNENATSSFIGDFDIRYLLVPNGNAALKVYNQTNDKYFTKNSLNTQGVGVILKKDFNGIIDLIPWKPWRRKE